MPYIKEFITGNTITLPAIEGDLKNKIAPLLSGNGHVIDYAHHSVVLNKQRKLAFYSASNIDGKTWKAIDRSGDFVKDDKLVSPDFQLGKELYDAIKAKGTRPNDFEQGHLTSFQEVLWGKAAESKKAANETFFYTNCAPQHERVNSGLWRSLEQYVLKTETVKHGLKVNVITDPLLSDKDPYYIEKINGEFIKIPCVFWKVIYYPNANGLNAVGFMMSHKQLLLQDGTVTFKKSDVKTEMLTKDAEDFFMDYKYDSVYQVKVEFIQQETGLKFMLKNVNLPFQSEEKKDMLYKRIEVMRTESTTKSFAEQEMDFKILNIQL
ncbi:MAG: DNA/RNA non-specific endonuclease [Ferruginibacter sp.]